DFARAGNRDALTLGIGNVTHGAGKTYRTGRLRFDRAGHGCTRCRATDVERTHRQLRARLTNGLSGDHTNGFAAVDQRSTTQVATIAVRAQAVTRFAGKRCTDLDFVDADLI